MASQAVRDLLWVVNSPSFVGGADVAAAQSLQELDIDEQELDEFIAQRPARRVGRYFENLLHFWLAHVRKVEIEASGLQIRDGKRTIGEIDYLYRDEAGALVHCEASVKFFLHYPRPDASHYPGPNAADNFELKTAKLFDHQLQISHEHVPAVQVREAFVKGMVFYRSNDAPPEVLPDRMAANHLRGSWLRASELSQLLSRDDVVCAVAEKPHWLAADASAALVGVERLVDALREHFGGDRDHPLMISLRDATTLQEVERLFVVNDRWPD